VQNVALVITWLPPCGGEGGCAAELAGETAQSAGARSASVASFDFDACVGVVSRVDHSRPPADNVALSAHCKTCDQTAASRDKF
jgi:hypothetical protein